MSFFGEMRDFTAGLRFGSELGMNIHRSRLARDKYRRFGDEPEDEAGMSSVFEDGTGGGLSTTSAPQVTGGALTDEERVRRRNAIASIESSGAEDPYRVKGKVVNRQGDLALGRYQIMASNVGPWSKQVLGQALTTDQFLNSPQAQDAIFDGIFDGYVRQYGLENAARAWYGGPGNINNTDATDLHKRLNIGEYGANFMRAYGAGAGGAPTTAVVATTTPTTRQQRGALPEEDEAEPEQAVAEEEGGEESAGADIDVPAAPQAAPVETVQVAYEQDPYRLYAARGGAIPDQTGYLKGGKVQPTGAEAFKDDAYQWMADKAVNQSYPGVKPLSREEIDEIKRNKQPVTGSPVKKFQGGGPSYMDKYNANRAYTQPIQQNPVMQAAGKISFPTVNKSWRNWGPGNLSPTQQKLAAARAAAVPKKPLTPDPPQRNPAYGPYTLDPRMLKGVRSGYRPTIDAMVANYNALPNRGYAEWGVFQNNLTNMLNQARGARPGGSSHQGAVGGTSLYGGGLYKEGGKVKSRDEEFKEWERRYSQPGGGGGPNDSARDRAARTMNRKYRNISSTAWPPPGQAGGRGPVARQPVTGGAPPAAGPPAAAPAAPPLSVRHPPNPRVGTPEPVVTGSPPPAPGRGYMPAGSQPSSWRPDAGQVQQPKMVPTGRMVRQGMIMVPEMVPEDQAQPPPQVAPMPQAQRLGFEKGGVIPDDTAHYEAGGSATTSRTGRRSSAIAGRTTKGGGAPQTKASKPVRKSTNKKPTRNAAKRPGKPPQSERVPVPMSRPINPGMSGSVPPATAPRMPPPSPPRHFDQISELIPQAPPVNINIGMPSIPPKFDQATQLIPQAPDIDIPVGASGSGVPPGSMEVQYPGVSPPVTGLDVPQGGQWPQFARGGAVPDDEEGPYPNWRAEEAGYTTSSADANVRSATRAGAIPAENEQEAAPAPEAQAPAPAAPRYSELKRAVSGAVDIGLRGLQNTFGMTPAGGVPTPEDDGRHSQGAQRLASGEGGFNSQEVAELDQAIGMDRMGVRDEGMKQLIRLDKMVNWYLQRGDTEKAEAAAMSLMQFGATKVRQAGTMAAAALSSYQESGDPQDLQSAIGYMKLAHQLIPDGFNIDIGIDPKTKQVVVTAVDDEGKAQKHVVDPQMIPQLLQKAIDGSAYWDSMMAIGHPDIALQRERDRGDVAAATDKRAYEEDWWYRQQEHKRTTDIEDEDRAAARKMWEREQGIAEGQTAGERRQIADQAFYDDWGARFTAAQGEEKQALMTEGLQHRYANERDRQTPVVDENLVGSEEMQEMFGEDMGTITEIARALGPKNPEYDASALMNIVGQLVTDPIGVDPQTGGMNVNGLDLVFNPQLLPVLGALRKKYRQQ